MWSTKSIIFASFSSTKKKKGYYYLLNLLDRPDMKLLNRKDLMYSTWVQKVNIGVFWPVNYDWHALSWFFMHIFFIVFILYSVFFCVGCIWINQSRDWMIGSRLKAKMIGYLSVLKHTHKHTSINWFEWAWMWSRKQYLTSKWVFYSLE